MSLIKFFSSYYIRKSLPIKNLAFFSTTPLPAQEERGARKTSLFDFHVARGGKIVNFAGYLLPVQYSDQGIATSHIHTRTPGCASIFDVSHMLQTYLTGKDAIECFESITTADIRELSDRNGTLTVFTNDKGGILDDLIVNRVNSEFLYVVSNAARKDHDSQLIRNTVDNFREQKGKSVSVRFFDTKERALLALQGPASAAALQTLTKVDLNQLYFMTTTEAEIAGVKDCRITRCGYTGEDGFEISILGDKASFIAEALLDVKTANVKLAGLGARDSLRLEAGMCLYGSDIDTTTTPIEAGLAWLVGKRRRTEKKFPGAEIIMDQLKNGVTRRRVGIRMLTGPPARHGVGIYSNGEMIGEITSGCPSPSLSGNVAMGYVKEEFKKSDTPVELKIRDKFFEAKISKMPFTKSNYYQKTKQ
ncbi:hypothetical protein PVAND_002478 [Polypedilum vanderplanki]|uniref:Aminomethyltransferase n=1 Tax=Polypedilum vanderplanki TaxID=319348 RepID=A0A9J6BR45_POLVA|nr:hypothetical protein PVAND_002478 [Polypedilum vanderplanki]